ncbi:MAG: hypothetical protein JST36_02755 [Bacteroidetes bacterium]|nr:hypothetical protein [Bacteroidota bacterium]
MKETENRSPHILNASSNLVGICLLIQTSIHVFGYSSRSYIDEITAVSTCLFITACLFSYLSIRSFKINRANKLEQIGDVCFLIGLALLLALVALISFKRIS